jgi:hypothetical protein
MKRRQANRKEPEFNPRLFPSCDSRPLAVAPKTERWLAVKREFLDAYYRVNVAYAKLLARRKDRRGDGNEREERPILRAIEQAILAKEAVEDRFASRGIIATPIYRNGFAVDVRFQLPGSLPPRPVAVISSAACTISFALPRRLRRKK